jgi:hypothetical protein
VNLWSLYSKSMKYQICLAKEHCSVMCSAVPGSWQQRAHSFGWSRPRRSKRSTVHNLFFMVNHMCNLCRSGAPADHKWMVSVSLGKSLKKTWYAD